MRCLEKNGIDISMIQCKRIIKETFHFIRLCLINKEKNGYDMQVKARIVSILKICLCANLKELVSHKKNRVIKRRVKKESEDLTILTLNINSVDTKREELTYQLSKHKPTILCLQETHRSGNGKKLFINGYKVIETYESNDNGNLGMAIGYRNDSDILVDIKEKTDNIIVISVKTKVGKIIVGNIYVPCTGRKRKAGLKEAADCLSKYNKNEKYRGVVILGDWNQDPEKTKTLIGRQGMEIYTNTCPKKRNEI